MADWQAPFAAARTSCKDWCLSMETKSIVPSECKIDPQGQEHTPPQQAKQATCEFIRSGGRLCRAFRMKTSPYCFTHNPETREARVIAWKHGGLAQKVTPDLRPLKIEKPRDVIKLVATTLMEVRDGHVDPRLAGVLFMGANVLLKAFEVASQEERLTRLETEISNTLANHSGGAYES